MKTKDENKVTKEEKKTREEKEEMDAAAAKIQVNDDILVTFQSFPYSFVVPKNINLNLLLIQAGFKGHKTRKELKSKANEKKEATPKKDHEGSKSTDASKTQ